MDTDITKYENKGLELVAFASSFEVTTIDSAQEAIDFANDIKVRRVKIETEVTGPPKKAAYDAWQISLGIEKKLLTSYNEAEKIIKRKISDYQVEQDRIRMEALKAIQEPVPGELPTVDPSIFTKNSEKINGSSSTDDWEITVLDMLKFAKWCLTKEKKPWTLFLKVFSVSTVAVKDYIKATGIEEMPGLLIKKTKRIALVGRK